MRDTPARREAFHKAHQRAPASADEYQSFLQALNLWFQWQGKKITVCEVRTQLEKIDGAEDHYLAIVKAETEKQQREKNA